MRPDRSSVESLEEGIDLTVCVVQIRIIHTAGYTPGHMVLSSIGALLFLGDYACQK